MSVSAASANKSTVIKWIMTAIIPLAIFLIPTGEVYTEAMRAFFVVTMAAILIMAFETLDTMAIAILLPMAYSIFCAPMSVVFGGWTSSTAYQCIGAMLLANVLSSVGFLNRICLFVITKCGGSFRKCIYGMFLIGSLISLFTGVMGGLLVCAFAYGLGKAFHLERGKASAVLMMMAIFSTTTIEMVIYKPVFMTLINSSLNAFSPGMMIQYLQLWLHNWPMIIFMVLMTEVYLRVYKIRVSNGNTDTYKENLTAMGKMSSKEKKGALLAIAVVVYMASSQFTGLTMDYGLMLLPWFAFLPGINIAKRDDVRNIQWDMIFFVMACMGIGSVSSHIGVASLVSGGFMETFSGYGKWTGMFIIYVLGIILNFLMTPMAMLAAFLEPVLNIAQGLGVKPLGATYIFYFACDQIILPYEYANYLLAYSFGMMSLKDFVGMTGIKMVLGTIFLFLIMCPYWMLLGIM